MTTPRRPDLMAPSLGRATRVVAVPGQEPWRLQSMFYVAFFGGAAALTWIAYQNAVRLQADDGVRKRIAIAGIGASILLSAGMGLLIADEGVRMSFGNMIPAVGPARLSRWVMRIVAVVLYLLFLAWLTPADRRYIAFGDGERASLWRPGAIAALAGDLAILILVAGFALAFGGVITPDFFKWR